MDGITLGMVYENMDGVLKLVPPILVIDTESSSLMLNRYAGGVAVLAPHRASAAVVRPCNFWQTSEQATGKD